MSYKILILLFISTVAFGQFTSDHTGEHIDSVITDIEGLINPTLSPSFPIGQGADSTWNLHSKSEYRDTLDVYSKSEIDLLSPLYDYQDVSLNSELQMLSRNAHYLFDKYYNSSLAACVFEYDITSDLYLIDRSTVARYLALLDALYENSGNQIYFNKMKKIYDELLNGGVAEVYAQDGSDTCFSIAANPSQVDTGLAFAHWDVPFHLAGVTIYEETGQTAYLTRAKDFTNVLYASINRDLAGESGWACNYYYDNLASANQRVNVGGGVIEWFNLVRDKGITTTTVSTALCDTLIDSVYAWMNDAWIATGDTGGWALRQDLVNGIDFYYNTLNVIPMLTCVESQGSLAGFQSDFEARLTKLVNYYGEESSENQVFKQNYFANTISMIMKWAKKWGITTNQNTDVANGWLAMLTKNNHRNGINTNATAFGSSMRRPFFTEFEFLETAIRYLNDETFNEDFTRYATSGWGTNVSAWYWHDGFRTGQRWFIGTGVSYFYTVGYYTADSSPLCPTEDNWTRSGDIVTISYPTQADGLTYNYKHRLGSSFSKVIPSSADTVFFTLDRADTNFCVYYYDTNFELQRLNNDSLDVVGDSIVIKGNRGLYLQEFASDIHYGVGMIFNDAETTFKMTYDSGALNAFLFSSQDVMDSIYVFYVYHLQDNFYRTDAAGYTYSNIAAAEILTIAKQILDNGLDYEGILTNKLE